MAAILFCRHELQQRCSYKHDHYSVHGDRLVLVLILIFTAEFSAMNVGGIRQDTKTPSAYQQHMLLIVEICR